jgi:hypothetical protein
MWLEMLDELKFVEIEKFRNSSPEDIETREQAYRRLRLFEDLETHVEWMASSQKMEEKRLKFF